MRTSQLLTVPALVATLLLSGCPEGEKPSAPAPTDAPSAADAGVIPAPMQAFKDDGAVAELALEGDDQMRFNKKRLTAKAGQMVRLTLKHVGTMPAQAMGHNVVILHPGDDIFEFGADVGKNGGSLENNYVPDAVRGRVVAFTPIVGGGETATVEFKMPDKPGEYLFLCSFPGHFGQMNGVFVVE